MPSPLPGLINNVQLPPVFTLIFMATVIRFRDRVDFDQVDFGVSHLKGVACGSTCYAVKS